MPRSTLYILIKYGVFLNWTLTGFWIIYNSSDYSKNAQIISEKIASFSDQINKENVVYCLICYTITLSCITFFGLVGVCYENFCLTLSLAIGYAIYILFDIISNLVIGVPLNVFFIFLQFMLLITCINLFFFAFLIRTHFLLEAEETRIYFEHHHHRLHPHPHPHPHHHSSSSSTFREQHQRTPTPAPAAAAAAAAVAAAPPSLPSASVVVANLESIQLS